MISSDTFILMMSENCRVINYRQSLLILYTRFLDFDPLNDPWFIYMSIYIYKKHFSYTCISHAFLTNYFSTRREKGVLPNFQSNHIFLKVNMNHGAHSDCHIWYSVVGEIKHHRSMLLTVGYLQPLLDMNMHHIIWKETVCVWVTQVFVAQIY